jgi:thioredoxin-dependent peroxiredoxin
LQVFTVSGTKTRVVKVPVVKKTTSKKITTKKPAITKPPIKKIVDKKTGLKKITVKVGYAAPAFSLMNQDGKKVSLSDYKDKKHVVLYFYPRAMTPGCTIQACGIRDGAARFKKMDAVVLGVSPDKVSGLAKFRDRDKLNFDLLSDEDKSLSKTYGAWGMKKFMGREFMGVLRWTFIIGKDGKIKYVIDDVNTKTHHEDVLALLKSL